MRCGAPVEGARLLDNLVQKPCTWTKPNGLESLAFHGFRLCSVRIIYNTEDKQEWVKLGLEAEYDFVAKIVPRINRTIVMNREKANNPYAIDLYDCDNNRFADLKTQEILQ